MSKKASGIPPEIRAKMEAAKALKSTWAEASKNVVNVPQAQAAFVPRAKAGQYPIVATRGVATCVGLIVEGEAGVFFAHIDGRSEPIVKSIAGVALGMVGGLRRISITTSQVLQALDVAYGTPLGPAATSAERIYRQLASIFIDFPATPVDVLQLTDIAFSFTTGNVTQAFPYRGNEHTQTPGVRYLSLLGGQLPTLQDGD